VPQMLPADAWAQLTRGHVDRVPVDDLKDRTTAVLLTPYPPGIPLLIPGERVNQTIVSTLGDCLARQHVCVTSEGRSLISQGQQAQLEQQIGGDDIYLVVAASGSSGYDVAMRQIISTLSTQHKQFVVGRGGQASKSCQPAEAST